LIARNTLLEKAFAGLKIAHLPKTTLAFEFSALTLTVPGLRPRKVQNPAYFCAPATFPVSLTALFRFKALCDDVDFSTS
jgi:hypothetical protein